MGPGSDTTLLGGSEGASDAVSLYSSLSLRVFSECSEEDRTYVTPELSSVKNKIKHSIVLHPDLRDQINLWFRQD